MAQTSAAPGQQGGAERLMGQFQCDYPGGIQKLGGKNRWAYMAEPGFNPPSNACPECDEPSKTYFIGAKTVMDKDKATCVERFQCEHKHEWTRKSPRQT